MVSVTGEPVGFIGLGLMGKPMALNLRKAGHELVVASRSAPPVDELVAAGARRAASPAEVAAACRVVITMLPDSPDVAQVLTGKSGVFETIRPASIVVDMSTISPVVTRELAERALGRGARLLDAPVSGGEIGAKSGTLSIMVGGDADALAEVRPLLECMGNPERIVHIGPSGAGQTCKACNQLVIGGTITAVAEAFALAAKAGIDVARVRQALLGGFAASRVLEVHGERMLKQDYQPGFRAHMYLKDLKIAVETAQAHLVPVPVTALVHQIVTALIAAGRGLDDYSALSTIIFEMARLEDSDLTRLAD
jgi:2-hydroxy-3-oxopropionate reductase